MNKSFPLFFEIDTGYNQFFTGVYEFSLEENDIEIPAFVANLHHLYENHILSVKLLWNIPFAKSLSLKPLSRDFFNLYEYEKILESELSKHVLLYTNQIVQIENDDKHFDVEVTDIQPDWSKVKLDGFQEKAYNIIEQNLEVDIYNSFLEEDLKKKRFEIEREEIERIEMKKEDINYYESGRKLGGVLQNLTNDEIRAQRLQKYKQKMSQKGA